VEKTTHLLPKVAKDWLLLGIDFTKSGSTSPKFFATDWKGKQKSGGKVSIQVSRE